MIYVGPCISESVCVKRSSYTRRCQEVRTLIDLETPCQQQWSYDLWGNSLMYSWAILLTSLQNIFSGYGVHEAHQMTTNSGRHYRRQSLWVTRGEPAPLSDAWVVNPFEAGCAVSGGGFHVLRKTTSVNLRHLHWKCEWVVCTVTLERND